MVEKIAYKVCNLDNFLIRMELQLMGVTFRKRKQKYLRICS